MLYLLLIFPLDANARLDALPRLDECLPLGNLARVVGKDSGYVGTNVEYSICHDLY